MTNSPAAPYRSALNELHPLWMLLSDDDYWRVDWLLRAADETLLRFTGYIDALYRQFVETKQIYVEDKP